MNSTPDPMKTAEITFHSEDETTEFARLLSAQLAAGDTILLSGPIGAGKSFLSRAIIQNRMLEHGAVEDVPSPTFTLVQTYVLGDVEFWHSDLYRLGDAYEIEELGLIDAFDSAVSLVEWPDRLGTLTPENAMFVELDVGSHEDERQASFRWHDDKWTQKILTAIAGSK